MEYLCREACKRMHYVVAKYQLLCCFLFQVHFFASFSLLSISTPAMQNAYIFLLHWFISQGRN